VPDIEASKEATAGVKSSLWISVRVSQKSSAVNLSFAGGQGKNIKKLHSQKFSKLKL